MAHRLRDLDIEEIALVEKGSEPVNDDARVELVKAGTAPDFGYTMGQPAGDETEGLVQRIAKAIKAVVTRKADDDGDGDDDDVQVAEGGTHGAYSGTHTHDHQDGQGGMHGHEHSHDGDGDHGHAHGVTKAQEATTLLGALDDVLRQMEKADVGAAVMAPARQHVAAMRAEAQAFLRLLRQTADGSPGPVTKATTQTDGQAESTDEMTKDEIGAAIGEALAATLPVAVAKALAPLTEAVDQKIKEEVASRVQEQVTDQVAPIAKAADEAIRKATAVQDQQTDEARKKPAVAPILNGGAAGAGLAHQAPAATDVSGMTYSSALRTLLHE